MKEIGNLLEIDSLQKSCYQYEISCREENLLRKDIPDEDLSLIQI
jgi:hypothetical protein